MPGTAGDYLEYADTAAHQGLSPRGRSESMSGWSGADIDFDEIAAPDKTVDPSDRRLRRYFNNGSFEEGGRLFGGFWQSLKKQERHEGISDRQTRRLSPWTMPRWRRASSTGWSDKQPPETDAYRIPGLEFHRDGVKKLFAAAMFSNFALSRAPQGTRKLLPNGMSVGHMVNLIKAHHRPIAHLTVHRDRLPGDVPGK